MTKIHRLLFLIVCLYWIMPVVHCFAGDPLRFVGVENVRPFAYEEDGVIKGYDVDIFMEMARRAKLDVKVELLPFKRGWTYIENGSADGSFMLYYSRDRENTVLYSKVPMHSFSYYVFVRKGHEFAFNTIKDLYGKRVANQMGFSISDEFTAAVREGRIFLDEARSVEMNLKKLYSGRVDCYVTSPRLIRYNTKDDQLKNQIVRLSTPIVSNKGLYFALSLKAGRISDKHGFVRNVEKILTDMENDKTIDTIGAAYFK